MESIPETIHSRVQLPLTSLTAIIVLLGGGEYLARILTNAKFANYQPPFFAMLPKGSEDWRFSYLVADPAFEPNSKLLWRQKAQPPINSQGFPGLLLKFNKPKNEFRIFCYSDINTETFQAGWPKKLQELLSEDGAKSSIAYRVVNAGVPGYSSLQGLRRFQEEINVYRPDLIIVSFGWNDAVPAVGLSDKDFKIPPQFLIAIQKVLLNYRQFLCLKYYLGKMIRFWPPPDNPRVALPDYISNMGEFISTGQIHHIPVVLLTKAHREKRNVLAEGGGWRSNIPEYNSSLSNFANKPGVLIVDLQRVFENISLQLFEDEINLSMEGHRFAAQFIYETLKGFSLLPQSQQGDKNEKKGGQHLRTSSGKRIKKQGQKL